jgi:hypothetical protein
MGACLLSRFPEAALVYPSISSLHSNAPTCYTIEEINGIENVLPDLHLSGALCSEELFELVFLQYFFFLCLQILYVLYVGIYLCLFSYIEMQLCKHICCLWSCVILSYN